MSPTRRWASWSRPESVPQTRHARDAPRNDPLMTTALVRDPHPFFDARPECRELMGFAGIAFDWTTAAQMTSKPTHRSTFCDTIRRHPTDSGQFDLGLARFCAQGAKWRPLTTAFAKPNCNR